MLDLLANIIKSATKGDELKYLISELAKKGIKCNYDPLASDSSRLLLYSNRYNVDNWNEIQLANGLIIDYKDLKNIKVIACPPELPLNTYVIDDVTGTFDKFQIYKITDGTTFTLYNYNGEWCIGTTRGIDVRSLKCNGSKKTYQQLFTEVSEKYPNFKVEDLDTKHSYTLSITHPSMHPFNSESKMKYICSYNLETKDRYWDEDIGLLPQEKVSFESFKELLGSIQNLETCLEKSNFGYVLRSPERCIMIESPLMRNIRQFLYDRRITENADALEIPRDAYILISTFLNPARRDTFTKLFPQFSGCMKELSDTRNKSVANIKCNNLVSEFDKLMARDMKSLAKTNLPNSDIEWFISNLQYIKRWYTHTNNLGLQLVL